MVYVGDQPATPPPGGFNSGDVYWIITIPNTIDLWVYVDPTVGWQCVPPHTNTFIGGRHFITSLSSNLQVVKGTIFIDLTNRDVFLWDGYSWISMKASYSYARPIRGVVQTPPPQHQQSLPLHQSPTINTDSPVTNNPNNPNDELGERFKRSMSIL